MGKRFSSPVHNGAGAQPAFYTMGTGSFPGVKQPRRGVDHPPHLAPRLKKSRAIPLLPPLDLRGLFSFIPSLVFRPRGRSGRNQSPVIGLIGLLAHCVLSKFLGVVCYCFPPPLDVPTFAATCICVRSDARDPSSERWNYGRERCPVILPKFRLPRKFRDLLQPANLRHGTDGFTSPPKEGVLRIFSP